MYFGLLPDKKEWIKEASITEIEDLDEINKRITEGNYNLEHGQSLCADLVKIKDGG